MVQPKVRIPEKDQKEVATTVLLLKKRAKTSNFAQKGRHRAAIDDGLRAHPLLR
jgi:hypothetical protein